MTERLRAAEPSDHARPATSPGLSAPHGTERHGTEPGPAGARAPVRGGAGHAAPHPVVHDRGEPPRGDPGRREPSRGDRDHGEPDGGEPDRGEAGGDAGPGANRQPANDLLRGHLEALLLAVLEDGPLHGYAIIEALRRRSGGALIVPTGTVYPALRRLERVGHLTSDWATIGGRRRRTYRLTSKGLRALAGERSAWRDFTSAIGSVLDPRPSRPAP